MASFANFGHFAGGLAKGLAAGSDEQRRREEERRRQEEYEYQQAERARLQHIRDISAEALARAGQPIEGGEGQIYTEEQAINDIAAAQARVDPTRALQTKAAGLQMKRARRQERREEIGEKILDLRRRLVGGDDPITVFQEATRIYNNIPDGKIASLAQVNGQPMLVLTNTDAGQTQLFPATPETVSKALDQLYMFSSPQAYQQGQEAGLKRKQAEAQMVTAQAAQANAETNRQRAQTDERYRTALETYYDRLGRAALSNAGARDQSANRWIPLGLDKDGQPVFFNQTDMSVKRPDGQSVQDPSIFQKVTGQRPAQPEALGSTGLIRIGPKLYTQDPRNPAALVAVETPESLDKVADTIRQNLGAKKSPNAAGGLKSPNDRQRPAVSGISSYGPMTPWSMVVEGMRKGDPMAFEYADRRIRSGPGMLGVNPPPEVLELLRRRNEFVDQ